MTSEYDYYSSLGIPGTLQDKQNEYYLRSKPYILAQSAVPVILVPSGTVAADGAITLGTALPTIYAGAWVRLPAGAVTGGLAGLYWATFSSTTVGAVKTLFVDAATAFTPYVPTVALVAAVGSAVAYTQTTAADITLTNITVPAGALGFRGGTRATIDLGANNNANAKTPKFMLGGVQFGGGAISLASAGGGQLMRGLKNRGSMASQIAMGASVNGYAGTTPQYLTINTAINQTLTFTGQLTVATDYIVLESCCVEVLPS